MAFLGEKDLFYEKDGAVWMKTQQFGDDKDRVLIKKGGEETYFLSDIAYHYNKFSMRQFKKVINLWGADHGGYVDRLQAAVKALGHEGKLDIIVVQMVRLISGGKEVKMSKRKGNFITLEELVDEVGLDAARFFFLMYTPNTHMNFDLDLAKEKSEKNPVYYVQYAHARICSIMENIKKKGRVNFKDNKPPHYEQAQELLLIKELVKLPDVLAEITHDYQVQRLPFLAIDIAKKFHNFYAQCRVIDNDQVNADRVKLIAATRIILQNVLGLMGIEAPKKM